MQQYKKDFAAVPVELQAKFEEKKTDLIKERENHNFNGYQVAQQDLLQLAHQKCVYCDRFVKIPPKGNNAKQDNQTATIEHYRPKSRGYWWLAYEWSNLYILCRRCNRNKSSKFPIAGTKAKAPIIQDEAGNKDLDVSRFAVNSAELLAERPYYLHPELVDDVDRFYRIQANGKLEAV